MEKKSKIEKLGIYYLDMLDKESSTVMFRIATKVDEIIDYLNTQPKEEVTAEWLYRKNRKRLEDLTEKELKKRGITKTQDTPEEKEVWEFDLRNLMYRDGEQLRCAGEGKPYTGEYRELVVSMIKQLLLERERWAIDTFLKDTASYNSFHNGRPRTMRNGLSGEGFEVRVSKLTIK